MRLARPQSHFGGDTPVLQRSATFAVVAALHILLLLLLLRLAPPPEPRATAPMAPISVRLIPEARLAPTRSPAPKGRAAPSGSARPSAPPVATLEPRPKPPPIAAPPVPPLPSTPPVYIIPLTRAELAAADIGRMPSRPVQKNGSGSGDSGSSAGPESGDAGPGRGPNGEPLYNADWQRRPTRAELAFYLPGRTPRTGWGMIACQTVAGFRVEDCRIIAESPVGSGLARAVQQAAWQFRVLPPRIGGRPLVGSWVRIRIEYTQEGPE